MITTLSSWVGLRLYFHAGCHSWRVSAQDSDSAFVVESAIFIPATEANAPLRPYFPRWPVVATFLGGWWRAAAAGSPSSTRVARPYATAICRTTARQQNAPRSHDSRDVVAKRFSSSKSVRRGCRTIPAPLAGVPGACRISEVRLPKQRRNPVTRLASHRRACPVTHGVASKTCGGAPSLEGNTCIYDAPTIPRTWRCDEAGNTFPRARADRLSLS